MSVQLEEQRQGDEKLGQEQAERQKKLRLNQFAHYIGTTIPNARGLIHRREVSFFKIGKLILVPLSEAERILRDGFRPRQDGVTTEK